MALVFLLHLILITSKLIMKKKYNYDKVEM